MGWFCFVLFFDTSTNVGYSMPNPFLFILTVLFQTIQFNMSTLSSSICTIDRTYQVLSPGQSGSGSDGKKGVFCIPQSYSFPGAWSWDCSASYTGPILGESYPSAEMQSVYSAIQVDWAITRWVSLTPLQRCNRCILRPKSTRPSLVGWVLTLCRDAVGVFCWPLFSRLSNII